MNEILIQIDPKEYLDFNAKLQKKKNLVRKALKEKGILQKGAVNKYDHYKYFSEAQYKQLFTELFSENGIELKFNEIEYCTFDGSEKQANGRMPKLEFYLIDIETGFFETTVITGEGIDKGDKAGYKAYTGALKYFLANTFMVATGDDPDSESPSDKMNDKRVPQNPKKKIPSKASPEQIDHIKALVSDIPAMLDFCKVDKIEDLTFEQANSIIQKKTKTQEVKQ